MSDHSLEDTDPLCLPPARAADLLADAPWRRFAVIGDSLSAGTGDPSPGYRDLGWADRVAGALKWGRPDVDYLNLARVGATTDATLATQTARMLEYGPDLVHVPSGANDLFRPEPDFTHIAGALGRVFTLAASTGARLTVFTFGRAFVMPRIPDWSDRVQRVNDIVRSLAADHDAVLVDMWDHPVNDRPGLVSADRIHFATLGQAALAAEVVRCLAASLAVTEDVAAGDGR